MKLKLSIYFLLAALCAVGLPASAQVTFKIPVVYTDSIFTGNPLDPTDTTGLVFSNTYVDTLWFGYHTSATLCRDTLRNFTTHWTLSDTGVTLEELLPPIGPGGQDVRFIQYSSAQGCFSDGSKVDIRKYNSPTQRDSMSLKTTPNPDPILFHREVLRWPTTLGQYFDSCRIVNVGGGAAKSTEMTQQFNRPSLLFNASQTANHSFRIIPSGPKVPPPTTPTVTLLTPADGATQIPLSTSITWQTAPGALFYRLQVSKNDPNFGAPSLIANDSLGASATSKALVGLVAATNYYWRVAVFTPGGVSYYQNPPFRFTTLILTLTTNLLSPANGAQGVATSPLVRWQANGAGATKYHLKVTSDTLSSSYAFNDSTLIDTFATPTLQNCVKYFWTARSFNAQGFGPFAPWRNFRVSLATPTTPVMSSPADGATSVALSPTLSWTNDVCTDSTRVQITTDTTGSPTFSYDVAALGTSRVVGPLAQNTTYFWRLIASNTLPASSSPSAYRLFTTVLNPPATPVLGLPNDLDSSVATSPTFTWNAVPAADSYTLKVYEDAAFTRKVFDDSTLTGTSQLVSGLENCTRYYWRVKAKNAAGSSPFTATRNFKTLKAAPGSALLLLPTSGQTAVAFTPRLIWSRPDVCADYFIVTLSKDAGFTAPNFVSRDSTIDTTIVVGPLNALTTYFWKVEAYNKFQGAGTASVSNFTVTDQTPPGIPVLTYPSDGQDGLPANLTLRWDSTDKASTYRVQVAYDSLFTQLIVNDSTVAQSATPGKAIGPLLNSRTYWWRVNAKNSKGTSLYSAIRRFNTLSPPARPTLTSPGYGATNVSVTPTFYWTLADRADSYHVQVSREPMFVDIVRNDSDITNYNWTIYGHLDGNRTYYWRVFGKNSVGYGDTSLVYMFKTERVGAPSWEIPVSICETGSACDTLAFGIDPSATYGIDFALGEYELPLPPPAGWFDVRFVDTRNPSMIGEGLRKNAHPFRSYAQIDTFKVKFQPGLGSYPIILSWDPSFISTICDSMVIKDEYTGAIVHQRMDLGTTVSTNLSSLLIIEYGAFPIPLGVKPPPPVRELPKGFVLSQNYPNPFNPTTNIDFSTDQAAFVTIGVYDVLGREVAILANTMYSSGLHHAVWDGMNNDGHAMPSGVYYVRMLGRASSEDGTPFSATRKIIMMK